MVRKGRSHYWEKGTDSLSSEKNKKKGKTTGSVSKSSTPAASTPSAKKKYKVSSSSKHISNIKFEEEFVDDILKLLLELEVNEKGYDSIDACISSLLRGEKSSSKQEEKISKSDSDSDSDSDSGSESSNSSSSVDTGDSDSDSVDGIENEKIDEDYDCHEALTDDKAKTTFEKIIKHIDIPPSSTSASSDGRRRSDNDNISSGDDVKGGGSITPLAAASFHLSTSLKKIMIKKLIRDDRRIANEAKAEQFRAREQEKAIKRARYETSQKAQQQQQQQQQRGGKCVPQLVERGATLRLQVCSDKNKSLLKVIVIDLEKGLTVEELVSQARNKLGVSKKFNGAVVLPGKKPLEDGDLRFLENDTQLCLVAESSTASASRKAGTGNGKRTSTTSPELDSSQKESKSSFSTSHIVSAALNYHPPLPRSATVIDSSSPLPEEEHLQVNPDCISDCEDNEDEVHRGSQQTEETVLLDPDVDTWTPVCRDESVSGAISAALRARRDSLLASEQYEAVLRSRRALPMFLAQDSLLRELHGSENRTMIVVGDTGCGKTTQVPQIILDHMISEARGADTYIICTQPRRIAAISVAERVAQERLERCGESVGYQIRLKSRCSKETRILFCTTGILLRKMQDKLFLNKVSHIIIDEVHERQVETDFVMAILKSEMSFRHNLHLVLMSATLNSEHLRSYMGQCPVIQVPGRLFPVAVHYMDEVNSLIRSQQKKQGAGGDSRIVKEDMLLSGQDSQHRKKIGKGQRNAATDNISIDNNVLPNFNADIVAEFIIRLIEKENVTVGSKSTELKEGRSDIKSKAVLVFLSGIQAITSVMNILRHRQTLDKLKAKVFILHSSVPAEQQSRVFAKLQNPFEWKIVLSTNIAESSVTVEDVVHVVDTGFHREMTFDPISRVSMLSTVFASKASLTQRCGRAGRVRPGDCWRLFSEEFLTSSRVTEYSLPEIKRVPLEDVVLQILILNLGHPREFLSKCMDPPSTDQVDEALQVLLEIGAILVDDRSISRSGGTEKTARQTDATTTTPLLYQPYLYIITPLGRHLANLPVDVRLGKMLIYASIFGCLEPALTIVATLSGKSPLTTPTDKRDEANTAHAGFCSIQKNKHPFFMNDNFGGDGKNDTSSVSKLSLFSPYSDHIAVVRAYDEYVRMCRAYSRGSRRGPEIYNFCKANYLSMKILDDITALREQFRKYLKNAGFISSGVPAAGCGDDFFPSSEVEMEFDEMNISPNSSGQDGKDSPHPEVQISVNNYFSASDAILRCVICSGLFPRVARVCRVQSLSSVGKGSKNQQYVQKIFESSGDTVSIHPTSLLSRHTKTLLEDETAKYKDEKRKEAFLVYYKKISSPLPQVYDCTEVSPVSLMLFGESFSELSKSKQRSKVIVNKWIHLGISEVHAVLIRKLRYEIEQILLAKAKGSENLETFEYLNRKQFLVTSILESILKQIYN